MDPCPLCDNQGAYPIRAARPESPPLVGLEWFYVIKPCECGRPSWMIENVHATMRLRRELAGRDIRRSLAS